MSDTISMLTAALTSDASSLETISHNIANANNVAYRREIGVSQSFANVADTLVAPVLQVPSAPQFGTAVDMTAGGMSSSSEPLHLAIEGPGYFLVSTPTGEMLTRRGDFQRNQEGNLATREGHVVVGDGGAIALGSDSPSIDSGGTVWIDGQAINRLRIVSVPNTNQLKSLGDGYFAPSDANELTVSADTQVRQGFLENSNVSHVNEMVRLMEVLRHFETAQRFVRGYDEMMSQAISQLGRV